MSSDRRNSTWTRSSATRFTKHANKHLNQHCREWPFHIYDGAASRARPLLDDVSKKGHKAVVRHIDKTFPNVVKADEWHRMLPNKFVREFGSTVQTIRSCSFFIVRQHSLGYASFKLKSVLFDLTAPNANERYKWPFVPVHTLVFGTFYYTKFAFLWRILRLVSYLLLICNSVTSMCGIEEVKKVNSPSQYGMYLLRKEEMQLSGKNVQEFYLYHVTSKSRALESLTTGLDWRRTERAKFGCGVSFSDDADYSNYFANRSSKEDTRVIIICTVLVNKTYQMSIKQTNEGIKLIVPPGKCDTTMSPNRRVYVKYNDYDFYPLFFVHFRRTPDHLWDSKYLRSRDRQLKKEECNRKLRLEEDLSLKMQALSIDKSSRRRRRRRR